MRSSSGESGPVRFLLAAALCAAALASSHRVAAAPPDTTAVERSDGEPYHLSADRLEGSAAAGENVYTARRAKVVHGTTTVTGDSALIYRVREMVLFRGNVKIVDGATRMWGSEASYERKTRLATLRGDVRIEESGAKITGREARFYRAQNRSVITGDARLEDSTRVVTADRIEYDRNKDIVTAIGNVDAYDRAESTRVRADRVRYDRRKDYAWAENQPVLELTERDGKITEVRGTTLEFDTAKRRVTAIDDVRIHRQDLRATCERAEFYQADRRAILLGSPKAWDNEGTARADTIEILFSENRLESLRLRSKAIVEYEAKPDSGRGERNIANGDTITVFFDGEQAKEAVIVGHAKSQYWPSAADSVEGGRNVSEGDTIHVFFEKGRPARAVVVGGSRGVYYLAAEGDTSQAASREIVRYSGTEIDYDVKQGTVDILGSADVVYKEMHLTANRITFDSKTNRMRAEGDPVLVDGKDRITGDTMTYDLNSRQGTVYEGRTVYDRGFIYGERVRKVSENVLDVVNGTYSTCDLEETHYHFQSSRMKVYLQDKVIARPVVFYIKRIPVLALPFYVFPIKPGRHSGFQLPQVEFGSSKTGGKFVRNMGYYWAINDYMDATAWFDYYQASSWVTHGQYRYHKRYGYQGQINSSYENQFTSVGTNRWDLIGNHYQTLGSNFALTAQANLTNSSDFRRDPNLGNNVLTRIQRNLRSNLSLQKGWSGGSFSSGLLQTQDLDAEPGGLKIQQQLPSVTFRINSRPIGHPARGQDPARLPWLASTTYSFSTTGLYERKEYETFTRYTFDTLGVAVDSTKVDSLDARAATRYDFGLSDIRTLLGFIRMSPRFTYSGVYYSRDQSGARNQLGGVWGAGVGVNTSIYGTFRTSIGPLRALRHVITPSASFGYQPKNNSLLFRDSAGLLRQRFDGVSGINLSGGEAKRVDFGLANDFHAKWGDPTQPKVLNNLIQLNTRGSYNLLAKKSGAKPLSDLSTSLRLRPIQRSDFDFNFVHNPYDGRLLQFSASTGLSFQGQSKYAEAGNEFSDEPGADAVQAPTPLSPQGLTTTSLPWVFAASISYSGSRGRATGGGYTTWGSSASLNGTAGLNPSKNWRVDYQWQFDVKRGQMVSQFFSVKRELHCWEMQFTRSISGSVSDEYYFKINVKSLPEVYYERGSKGLRGFGGISNLY
ncbi:MAG TPA: putative LPS assembly protein LptD [Candidatus Eisenbacteria bacterium]|nr:putative LPS assembly protein LptD [Candidatus Eisenbacteria bacterium]